MSDKDVRMLLSMINRKFRPRMSACFERKQG